MKRISVGFVDHCKGYNPQDSQLMKLLRERFGAIYSETPDYLICQPFGHDHFKYNDAIKIFYSGENVIPDFNIYDYGIGFDHLTFGDRYVRVPYYALSATFKDFRSSDSMPSDEELLNRKFCCFVVSNGVGADPIREKFFYELSKYRKVDSGGRYMNNIGSPVVDKQAFVRGYKFCISFENSSHPGYVTEKIMDAQAAWSVPIYWGDPKVTTDFRPQSFVHVKDESDINRAIEQIVELDSDNWKYLEMCKDSCLMYSDRGYYMHELEQFFSNIFSQNKESARRRTRYGFNERFYQSESKQAFAYKTKIDKLLRVVKGLTKQ